MFPHESFTLNRQAVLLAMISAAFPAVGYGAAGRVDFSSGDANVTGRDGATRALAKGAEVNPGDTITTNQGRAQVRFSDGAFVSIQPETTFRVDEYAYGGKPDGSEKGFFSLLKGAMRTVTGAIGRVNRQAYQVYTPSATIGIRGTGYIATVTNPVDTYVWEGQIVLQNKKGSLVCDAGQRCIARSQEDEPEKTGEPGAGPGPDPLGGFVGAFGTCNEGPCTFLPVSLSEPGPAPGSATALQPGANLATLAFNIDFGGGEGGIGDAGQVLENTTITLNSALGMESFVDGEGLVTRASNTLTDVGRDPEGIVIWGRWTGGITGGTGNASGLDLTGGEGNPGSLHYVAGIPTPLADIDAMKASGVIAQYSLISGTRPTETSSFGGPSGAGSAPTSGEMTVAFSVSSVLLSMLVPAPSGTYSMGASGTISGTRFSGSGSASGNLCSGGCSASIAGAFFGANAIRSGVVYEIVTDESQIYGAAGFAKTSQSSGGLGLAAPARRAR